MRLLSIPGIKAMTNSVVQELYSIAERKPLPSVQYNIPYSYQIESVSSGLLTPAEYRLWRHYTCGMACLRMILADKLQLDIPVIELARKAFEYKVYVPQGGTNTHPVMTTMQYFRFKTFVEKEFRIPVQVCPFLTLRRALRELSQGKYVMLSVCSQIRAYPRNGGSAFHKGGHLVLLTGYDAKSELIFIHNSSGRQNQSRYNHSIAVKDFKQYFAIRGLLLG